MKHLYRSRKNKVFAGVCGGLGDYFNIDPAMVRVLTVLLTLLSGIPLILYILAIFIVPREPEGHVSSGATSEKVNPSPSMEFEPPTPTPHPHEREEDKERMAEHVKIIGILYLVLSSLGIIFAVLLFGFLSSIGYLTGNPGANAIIRLIALASSVFFVVISIPGFFAGLGLMKRESWGRMLALILGFINLINFPLGTALGIYSIWALTNSATIAWFEENKPEDQRIS
ncbi:MAG: PspC domain-containing protein [Candidatus Omnitrophota bacterium]